MPSVFKSSINQRYKEKSESQGLKLTQGQLIQIMTKKWNDMYYNEKLMWINTERVLIEQSREEAKRLSKTWPPFNPKILDPSSMITEVKKSENPKPKLKLNLHAAKTNGTQMSVKTFVPKYASMQGEEVALNQ
jgi:hypothetical protein